MSDQREPFGSWRKSREPQSRKAERTADGDPVSNFDRASNAREATIRAVAELLSSKKDGLDKAPTRPSIPLADLAKPLSDLAQKLKKPAALRAKVEMPGTLLDPPPLNFPEAKEAERSVDASTVTDSVARLVPAPTVSPDVYAFPVAPKIEPVPGDSPDFQRKKDDEISSLRLTMPIAHAIEPGASIAPTTRADSDIDRQTEGFKVAGSRSDSNRVDGEERAIHSSPTVVASQTSALNRFEDSGSSIPAASLLSSHEVRTTGSGPAIPSDDRTASARSVDQSANSIRNPLSKDLRNFAMTNPAGSELDRNSLGPGASDSMQAGLSAGSSSSMSEGGAMDLSRTNELLQQLVDAVRKPRGSSLPVGGPLVYSDR